MEHRISGLVVSAIALTLGAVSASGQVKAGDMFPPLFADGLSGLAPENSGHACVVDFWASWCAPCKASFPAYTRLQNEFSAEGLVVIGVGVDESAKAFAAFVAKMKPQFPTLHDSRHRW